MRRLPSAKVASEGVTATRTAIESSLNWIFREQPSDDYGIDAHVEVVDGDVVTGRLLAVQIKAGASWFKDRSPDGWWFRPDQNHVNYWLSHSLPVIVVLYDPATKFCHWQAVTRETLVATSTGGSKISIPQSQILVTQARDALAEVADGDPYELRLRSLRLAKPWMQRLADGERLVIDVTDWVNKSLARGEITLGIDREDGLDPEPIADWALMVGGTRMVNVVEDWFAWANLSLHEETYAEADYDAYESECVRWDEGDRYLTESFEEWAGEAGRGGDELRPYSEDGEVAAWRLELSLNDLGRGFLAVDAFADRGRWWLSKLTP